MNTWYFFSFYFWYWPFTGKSGNSLPKYASALIIVFYADIEN